MSRCAKCDCNAEASVGIALSIVCSTMECRVDVNSSQLATCDDDAGPLLAGFCPCGARGAELVGAKIPGSGMDASSSLPPDYPFSVFQICPSNAATDASTGGYPDQIDSAAADSRHRLLGGACQPCQTSASDGTSACTGIGVSAKKLADPIISGCATL